jgi:hypothetical protein
MKLVAFNSTPRNAETSKTEQPLEAFWAGTQEGANCEVIIFAKIYNSALPQLLRLLDENSRPLRSSRRYDQ